jgi:hyperosmotically inducible periplasmic protein
MRNRLGRATKVALANRRKEQPGRDTTLIRRLFALVILLTFAAGGLYYWKARTGDALRLPPLPKGVAHLQTNLKDAAITTAVRAAFSLNRATSGLAIDVATQNGAVALAGEVPDEAARTAAERVAGAVPEVLKVANQLRVGTAATVAKERSVIESFDDEKLALQVKAALSLNRKLRELKLEPSAYRGVVTLAGDVSTSEQKQLALSVARDTPGVSDVTDAIRIAGHDATPR